MGELRDIAVRVKPAASKKKSVQDPYTRAKNLLRGALVIPPQSNEVQDPSSYWGMTGLDYLKSAGLGKIAGFPLSVIEGTTRVAALPLHLLGAAAQKVGLPVAQLTQDPAKLQMLATLLADLPQNLDKLTGHEHDPEFVARRHWM